MRHTGAISRPRWTRPGRHWILSASAAGAYTRQVKNSLAPTATQAVTLTGWFYLVFHVYVTVAAGNIAAGFGFGLAAFAELFAGLTIARLFKN